MFADAAKADIGEKNLVVKTKINPAKNAIVVDSHIKTPKQSGGNIWSFLEWYKICVAENYELLLI